MSQAGIVNVAGGGGGGSPVQTLTGNTGGAVPPTANNINIVGSGGVIVNGNMGTSTLTISLTEDAPSYVNVTHAMSPYTVLSTDYFISVDASGGTVTINLPDAPTTNQQFIIKDRLGYGGENIITIKSLSGVTTIDTEASYVFEDDFESLECLYHSGNYEGF